jgi:hypothetical protein
VLFNLIAGWQSASSSGAPAPWFDCIERATLTYEDLGCAWLLA